MKKIQNKNASYISPEAEIVCAAGSSLVCVSPGINEFDRSEELGNIFEN